MFFVIGQAKCKQDEDGEQYNHELVNFAYKVGRVNSDGFGKPLKVVGGGEKFYYCHSDGDENHQCSKDCDTAAERNNSLMVSVFDRRGDETSVSGQLSYESCQDDR